jgi:hypothetical protein
MEMDDKMRRELAEMLQEMRDYLHAQKMKGRPTELIPVRAENVTRKLMDEQREKCTLAWEKAIDDKLKNYKSWIKRLEGNHQNLHDKIFKEGGVVNGSKTTHESFRTLSGRVGNIEERLNTPGQNDSYEVRMRELEDWIAEEEERRENEEEGSRQSFKTALTIISIVVAIIFGAGGLVLGILQLAS